MIYLHSALLHMLPNGADQGLKLAKGEAFCRRAKQMGADIAQQRQWLLVGMFAILLVLALLGLGLVFGAA